MWQWKAQSPGPHDYITMGGMYTNIKIREKIDNYDTDPGWYEAPAGTLASVAGAEELRRDGIEIAHGDCGGGVHAPEFLERRLENIGMRFGFRGVVG